MRMGLSVLEADPSEQVEYQILRRSIANESKGKDPAKRSPVLSTIE